jgi:hypothetical protein
MRRIVIIHGRRLRQSGAYIPWSKTVRHDANRMGAVVRDLITELLGLQASEESDGAISDKDIVASATLAIEEIRRQLDQQSTAADSVDTKGAAVLTLTGTVAGLVATRVQLDSDVRVAAGAISLAIVLAILGCCIQAVRPRKGFSYGADAPALVDLLDKYSHLQVTLAVADSLKDARAMNVLHLHAKQSWYQNALYFVVAGVGAVALMVAVGAIR